MIKRDGPYAGVPTGSDSGDRLDRPWQCYDEVLQHYTRISMFPPLWGVTEFSMIFAFVF